MMNCKANENGKMSFEKFREECYENEQMKECALVQLELTIEDQGYLCEDGQHIWSLRDQNWTEEMCLKAFYDIYIK